MSTELVDPLASVRRYLAAEKSPATRRAYAGDWADFQLWCDRAVVSALPAAPLDVARYLAQIADAQLKASTIVRRSAAIRHMHLLAGFPSPTEHDGVKSVMRGIRREIGVAPVRKSPMTAELLVRALDALPDNLPGARDRALLLIGFAAALRRSELVALQVRDVSISKRGMHLHLRRSKVDQEGEGATIPVSRGSRLKPVDALERWLAAAAIKSGPIFREVDRHGRVGDGQLTDRSVARIIKRTIKLCGIDETAFSGHSLRSGFVSEALDNGIDHFRIMRVTRHRRVDTLRAYDRREGGFDDYAGDDFV